MDDELLRLARAAADDPRDEQAARAYDAALRRAGRREEVYERFKLKFECPKKWDELEATPGRDARHCEECQKEVRWVRNEQEFMKLAEAGQCVAFDTRSFESVVENDKLNTARDENAPCLLPAPVPRRWPSKGDWAELVRRRDAAASSPADETEARAYEEQLLRVGDESTLHDRLVRKFKCDTPLPPGATECPMCGPLVAARTADELATRVLANESIAVTNLALLDQAAKARKIHGATQERPGRVHWVMPRPVVTMGVPAPPRRPEPPPRPPEPPAKPGLFGRLFGPTS